MVLRGSTGSDIGANSLHEWKSTRMSVCLYWVTDGEITTFYMSSKKKVSCGTTKPDPCNVPSKQTASDGPGMQSVCWDSMSCDQEKSGWSHAECTASCICAVQERGAAPSSGKNSFEKKFGITRDKDGNLDKEAAVSNLGEKLVKSLIENENKVPRGWEVMRWTGCRPSGCTPGTEDTI